MTAGIAEEVLDSIMADACQALPRPPGCGLPISVTCKYCGRIAEANEFWDMARSRSGACAGRCLVCCPKGRVPTEQAIWDLFLHVFRAAIEGEALLTRWLPFHRPLFGGARLPKALDRDGWRSKEPMMCALLWAVEHHGTATKENVKYQPLVAHWDDYLGMEPWWSFDRAFDMLHDSFETAAVAVGAAEVQDRQKREQQNEEREWERQWIDWVRTMSYPTYLKTDHWKQLRGKAIRRADGRCQLCNGTDTLNVHHRTYEHLGREEMDDLIVLCRHCHAKHHDKLP